MYRFTAMLIVLALASPGVRGEAQGRAPNQEDREVTDRINTLSEHLLFGDNRKDNARRYGGTAVRDAIETAEGYLRDHATQDRRVLLVITDGIDNASTTTAEAIQRTAERRETVIDAVGLFHAQDAGRAGEGRKELHDLTERTDGVASFPENVDQIESVAVDQPIASAANTPLRTRRSFRRSTVRTVGSG